MFSYSRMDLPDLKEYLINFEKKGVIYPLPTTTANKSGLLNAIPTPPVTKKGWPWTEETNPSIYNSTVNWPKITIVTPSYNQEQFIEQTIRSVLLQNYPNLEYIIIDGGSTDSTKEILEKYTPWISYWHSEKDDGQGNAINQGFSLAAGDYYSWINSDDYYLKDVFNTIANNFLKSRIDFIYGYGYSYHTKEHRFELIKVPLYLDYFIRIPTLVQPSCFWRATIHQPVWEELQCSLDYELWLRLVKGQRRKLLKTPLSVANVHDNAKTSDPKMKAAWEKDHQLICSENAHGAVYNWNKLIFLNYFYKKIENMIGNVLTVRKS